VILGYFEDESAYATLAMNGWMEGDPAWWLNLQANSNATVAVKGGAPVRVRARAVTGEERDRLWARWKEVNPDLDGWAARRSTETPVVLLEQVGDSTLSGEADG